MKISLLLSALALTAVLALFGQDGPELPDGKGKDLVTDVCSGCHDLARIPAYKGTQDWGVVVYSMRQRGLALKPEETEEIVAYLAKNFPLAKEGKGKAPEPAKPATPQSNTPAPTQPK